MGVMLVRHMRMCMLDRFVVMQVAVRPRRHRLMRVGVVAIVMAVGVFVRHRFVRVCVRV